MTVYSEAGISRRIKQHLLSKNQIFFAVIQPGFEETALREFNGLGISAKGPIIPGGFEFEGGIELCWKVCLCSRVATRILMRIDTFRAENFGRYEKKMSLVPWELYVSGNSSVEFKASSLKSRLYHSGALEEKAAQCVSGRLGIFGKKIMPGGDSSCTVFIRAENDTVTVSIDACGDPLYKRSGVKLQTDASIRETIAAAILLESGVKTALTIIDPMCGSGTFGSEACGIIGRIQPGISRSFAFMEWPSFKINAFEYFIKSLGRENHADVTAERKIIMYDIDPYSAETAGANISSLYPGIPSGISLTVTQGDFFRMPPPDGTKKLIVMNPPYGNRLKTRDPREIYRKAGKHIKQYYPDAAYAIISPDLEYEKILSLPYDRKILFSNGGIKAGVIIRL